MIFSSCWEQGFLACRSNCLLLWYNRSQARVQMPNVPYLLVWLVISAARTFQCKHALFRLLQNHHVHPLPLPLSLDHTSCFKFLARLTLLGLQGTEKVPGDTQPLPEGGILLGWWLVWWCTSVLLLPWWLQLLLARTETWSFCCNGVCLPINVFPVNPLIYVDFLLTINFCWQQYISPGSSIVIKNQGHRHVQCCHC